MRLCAETAYRTERGGNFLAMLSGCLPISPGTDASRLAAHLATCLDDVRASAVRVDGYEVSFEGGIFRFVMSWNVLVPFGSGALVVDPVHGKVCYRLNVRQLLVFGAALSILIVAFGLANGDSAQLVALAPIMWLWLVGGNLLIGIPRFRRFLVRTLSSAPARQNS